MREEQAIKPRRRAGAGALACCWKRLRATAPAAEGSAVQSLACLDRFQGVFGRIAAENKEATLPVLEVL